MILQRLYELARREGLLDDVAFERQPVPYIVKLNKDGTYLGVAEYRGEKVLKAKKGKEEKRVPDAGMERSCPQPHGNIANRGFARYFVDTLPRVLPVAVEEKDREKFAASRETFWRQVEHAAGETNDPALLAVRGFGRQLGEDEALRQQVLGDLAKNKFALNDRCSFAWGPHFGETILEASAVREWYARFFQAYRETLQGRGPRGFCQVTGKVGPVPTTHAARLSGIPGGLSTGVSLISYDKQAFASYGLEGTENAAVGYEAADGYLRALQALIDQGLKQSSVSRLFTAGVLVLFWTREPARGEIMCVEEPKPGEVESLLKAAFGADRDALGADANQFYLLALSGNSARAIVRDYLELPLPEARRNLARWFQDLAIADARKDGVGQPTCLFPLSHLAVATALDFDGIAEETPAALLRAAIKGTPVPESLLVACLRRLRAEGRGGFRPSRMALIKLILIRGGTDVTEKLSEDDPQPVEYVYGRLLSLFEQIQYAALGEVNANVVDKFYGTFSAAPALLFARLHANAHNHLRKMRGEEKKRGALTYLDRRLTELMNLLPAKEPAGQLPLRRQALVALGYYHEKASDIERRAARKAAKLAAAEKKAGTV